MGEQNLHGTASSPYVYRVMWALKLKGLDYEYIDEDLSNKSNLLLKYNTVYKKINMRKPLLGFGFNSEMISYTLFGIVIKVGEGQKKAIQDSLEVLKILEEHGLGAKKFFGGETIGLMDMTLGWMAYWISILEEIAGVKLLEEHKFPRLFKWIKNFKEFPIIKENLPDYDKTLARFKGHREKIVGAATK
ncbi:hypothetical protein GIB67_028149 [Kingdonia uniflora]|uniref:Glutathione S-transferase n=1 Tax=Kingdonia uniflora TaxID=39325 RepID=A0A7J7KZM4_9MAGN|nr:hypothetical protein GIB67_028149 [Kingdonia uniflora]